MSDDQHERGQQVLAVLYDIMAWKLSHRHWWQRRHTHVWWEYWDAPVRVCRRCGLVTAKEPVPFD